MAKIKPMGLIESMSGKVCSHSDTYFRTNRRTGAVSSGKLCYPSTAAPTANQTAVRTKFTSATASAKTILSATATDTDLSNYTKLTTYQSQYNAARNFGGSLYNFIVKHEYAALAED